MIIKEVELKDIIKQLADAGNTYLCEMQFQFDFALALRQHFQEQGKNDVHIFLEYPSDINGKRRYYDIVIEENNKYCVIELKYKTAAKEGVLCYGQTFDLINQAAQDLARYDYWKDVFRIENFGNDNHKKFDCGYAILLTNDKTYWDEDGKGCLYEEFATNEGRVTPTIEMKWRGDAKAESVGKCRMDGIKLDKSYHLVWDDFGKDGFKYLLLKI